MFLALSDLVGAAMFPDLSNDTGEYKMTMTDRNDVFGVNIEEGWDTFVTTLYLAVLPQQQPFSQDLSPVLHLQLPVITEEELNQGDCSVYLESPTQCLFNR